MKNLKEYICERYKGYGNKSMHLGEICQALRERGIFKIDGKNNPDFEDVYKSLSFYSEMDDKFPYNIKLDWQSQYIYFPTKNGDSLYVYFRQMHEGQYGTKDDLMKIVKYLRQVVKDTDDRLGKYAEHPKMIRVKETIKSFVYHELQAYNKKNGTEYQYEVRDYSYRADLAVDSHNDGTGNLIELFAGQDHKTIGIMCFWEDTLGCLHFSFSRGGVWDGSTEELVEWNVPNIKKKVKWFVETTLR
jgi:hypothetical protein